MSIGAARRSARDHLGQYQGRGHSPERVSRKPAAPVDGQSPRPQRSQSRQQHPGMLQAAASKSPLDLLKHLQKLKGSQDPRVV